MKVIDLSKWNGDVNFLEASKHAEGVIIRAGYRGYSNGKLVTDTKFKVNMIGANASGMKVGLYFVTQAISEQEAREEARYTTLLIRNHVPSDKRNLALPIFIDSEDACGGRGRADHSKLSRAQRTKILNAFCEEIEKAGYKAGIYCGEYWLKTYLTASKLNYYLWVAKYSKNKPTTKYNAWQYTDKGTIPGIKGKVDISEFEEIKTGRNVEQIAEEVINGLWGNGEDRKNRLTKAGFNYKEVQTQVNRILKERGLV